MADFFKGLSGGFNMGLQLGEQLNKRRQREALAQAAEQYNVTEAPVGEQLQDNLAQVRGLQEQAIAGGMAPEEAQRQYAPSIAELERRVGLAKPEYYVSSGGQAYTDREAAKLAAGGSRAEAMAQVYRQFGAADKADELEQRAIDRAYQAQRRPLELQGLQQGVDLNKYRLGEAQDTAAKRDKLKSVDADVAGWMSKRLTDAEGNQRAPTTDDMIAGVQYRVSALQSNGLSVEAAQAMGEYQQAAIRNITLTTEQRNRDLGAAALAISQGDLEPARQFYDTYVLDGAKVTGMKRDPKTGAITISRVRDDGVALPDTKVGSVNELLAGLNSFKDPMALYNFSQTEFKNNLDQQRLDLERERVGISRGQLNVQRAALNKPQNEVFYDDKLRPVVVDLNKLPVENGVYKLPEGLTKPGGKDLTEAQKIMLTELVKSDKYQRASPVDQEAMLRANGIDPARVGKSGPPGGGSITDDEVAKASKKGAAAPAAPAPATGLQPTPPKEQSRRQYDLYNKAARTNYKVIGPAGADDLILEDPKGGRVLASKVLE